MNKPILAGFAAGLAGLATPVAAEDLGPVAIGSDLTLDPIIDLRLRLETVEQPTIDASALTARLRAGVQIAHASGISLLAEAEGTGAAAKDYNAFPFALASRQRRPGYAVVPDAENLELNRFQLQWKGKGATVTIGRQRINLDDQRWVGNAGWRQNEQTFDAVRTEMGSGPVALDAAYMVGQRSVFGAPAGARTAYSGDFVLLGLAATAGPVRAKAFAYLLDYDEAFFVTNSSQSYGIRASLPVTLGKAKLDLTGSYARQSDFGSNPRNYRGHYIAGEATLVLNRLSANAGYEKLGSDRGVGAVQTPMATLHKFNGWADLFLTTPAAGLQDRYAGLAFRFAGKRLRGLTTAVTYHRFSSDQGALPYGKEWDASAGMKVGKVQLLAKYADYTARGFGADTRKFWLQADIGF